MFASTETWNGSLLVNLDTVETIEPQGEPDTNGNFMVDVYFVSGRHKSVMIHESEAKKINNLLQLVEIKKEVQQNQQPVV